MLCLRFLIKPNVVFRLGLNVAYTIFMCFCIYFICDLISEFIEFEYERCLCVYFTNNNDNMRCKQLNLYGFMRKMKRKYYPEG